MEDMELSVEFTKTQMAPGALSSGLLGAICKPGRHQSGWEAAIRRVVGDDGWCVVQEWPLAFGSEGWHN